MTKKDYIKIAQVLKDEKVRIENEFDSDSLVGHGASTEVTILSGKIAYMLAQDNPRFDREQFLTACGYNS
jgi:hypothetical protein